MDICVLDVCITLYMQSCIMVCVLYCLSRDAEEKQHKKTDVDT